MRRLAIVVSCVFASIASLSTTLAAEPASFADITASRAIVAIWKNGMLVDRAIPAT